MTILRSFRCPRVDPGSEPTRASLGDEYAERRILPPLRTKWGEGGARATRGRVRCVVPFVSHPPHLPIAYAMGPFLSPRKRAERASCSRATLPRQPSHRAVEAVERQREHAAFYEIADHLDRGRAFPVALGHRVEPDGFGIGGEETAHPHLARLLVPMLDAAAGLDDLIRAHAGIADEDQLVAGVIGVEHLHRRRLLDMPAPSILPQGLIGAVVEVEIFEMLELGAGRGEELLASADMPVHRAADIEEEKHLHRIVPLRHQLDVEPAGVARG